VSLGQYLREIAEGYDRGSIHSAGHVLLAQAADRLGSLLPAGLQVEGSGGKGVATFTPWIGIFDPDETDTPQEGIYIVYIYATSLDRVVLTLNQGVTRLRQKFGDAEARLRLSADAAAVRDGLGDAVVGTLAAVNFGSAGGLQKAYEAGNICAIEYSLDELADEARLLADLNRFVRLYQHAIVVKRDLLQSDPGKVSSPSVQKKSTGADLLRDFAPKDDSEYVAHLAGRTLVKSRRHETLVREYGLQARSLGFSAATNVHPRDLTLRRGEDEWLVEAKVVYRGNATTAVRDAIGQLLQYRHFLYPIESRVRLVALFTEPVGKAYVGLLASAGIEAVWKGPGGWQGDAAAQGDGLV
jgi:MrcB-like, N-terminal domain